MQTIVAKASNKELQSRHSWFETSYQNYDGMQSYQKPQFDAELLKRRFKRSFLDIEEHDMQQAIKNSLIDDPRKQQLQDEASKWGLTCVDVSGDGRCLFHAVAAQLQAQGTNYSWEDVLEKTVAHIVDNVDLYSEFMERSPNDFIEGLISGADWAENIVITALSRELQVNIAIIRSDAAEPTLLRREGAVQTLYLGYEVGLHYQSILMSPEEGSQEKIAPLLNRLDATEIDSEVFITSSVDISEISTTQKGNEDDDHAAEKQKRDPFRKDEDDSDDPSFGGSPSNPANGTAGQKDAESKKRARPESSSDSSQGESKDRKTTEALTSEQLSDATPPPIAKRTKTKEGDITNSAAALPVSTNEHHESERSPIRIVRVDSVAENLDDNPRSVSDGAIDKKSKEKKRAREESPIETKTDRIETQATVQSTLPEEVGAQPSAPKKPKLTEAEVTTHDSSFARAPVAIYPVHAVINKAHSLPDFVSSHPSAFPTDYSKFHK